MGLSICFLIFSVFSSFLGALVLCFMWFRWENCVAGCNSVVVWRLNVYFCVPLDSCSKPKWRGDSPWFHLCNFHVGFNVGKLCCFSTAGPRITQSWKLHADRFCDLFCFSPASHCDKCMSILQFIWYFLFWVLNFSCHL